MITPQELNALVELLQRTPMSRAEALWVGVFTTRLQAVVMQEARRLASALRDDAEAEPQAASRPQAQQDGDDDV